MQLLIVNLNNLGDLVLMTPLLDALHAGLAPTRVGLVAKPHFSELFAGDPRIDDFFAFDAPWTRPRGARRNWSLRAMARLVRGVRAKGYDTAAVTVSDLRSNALARACVPGSVFGVAGVHGERLLSRCVAQAAADDHEVTRLLELLTCWGLAPADYLGLPCSLHLSAAEEQSAALQLRELAGDGPALALHVGSNFATKNWPLANFIELSKRLMQDGARIVLLGASADEVLAADSLEAALEGEVLNLAGQTSLVQLAGVLAAADLFVGNDSGPAHMANAVGTPSVTLFAISNWMRWGPWRQDGRARVCHPPIDAVAPGQPAYVQPLEVYEACRELLA